MGGSGAGSRLPIPLLIVAGASTLIAVLVSTLSILLQLRNYRKPALQRMVVRIMIMVPLYAVSSLISLFSVEAAFFIDAIRDIYEAFVIYCFFTLLTSYLGGERSLLILLRGRPPKEPVFPVNLIKREIDVSDPHTFLFLKRGILQYVQVKPVLAFVTMFLKAIDKFNEGDFRANSGYLYVSSVYNVSICLALYCLAMFWVVVNDDLKRFRPVPKFLCVKGILFFSFWQSVVISALVAANIISRLGPYTNPEKVSVGLNDLLICMEMPFFAIAHNYAFSYHDFIDAHHTFVARMPMYYAFRDAFGAKDVVEDSKATLRGEGMDYREFEPAEGPIHQGVGLENRIRAGLRYSRGGRKKYWLPKATADSVQANKAVAGDRQAASAHAPLLAPQADVAVHLGPDMMDTPEETAWDAERGISEEGYELPFGDMEEADEVLFEHCKKYLFGDYNYPTIDVSSEGARITIWTEEERVLRDERGAWFSPIRGSKGMEALKQREGFAWSGYGAVDNSSTRISQIGKQPDQIYDGQSGERIIDHEEDRIASAAAEPSDVIMRWTKLHRSDSDSGSKARTALHQHAPPNVQGSERARSSPPDLVGSKTSGSSSTLNLRSSPSISRNNSRLATAPSTLPPDAVDLVIEESSVNEPSERRRSDSGTGRGPLLKKVYRQEFVTGEGSEGIDEDLGSVRHSPQERPRDGADMVPRSSTSPLQTHLQTYMYRYDDIPHDHNPWA